MLTAQTSRLGIDLSVSGGLEQDEAVEVSLEHHADVSDRICQVLGNGKTKEAVKTFTGYDYVDMDQKDTLNMHPRT